MLAYGKIVYSQSKIIEELVSTAKRIIEKLPPKMVEFELELQKYFLDDCYKDFEDALVNQDRIGASLLRNKIINSSIDVFCRIHRIWRNKEKRISKQVGQIDPKFLEHVELAFSETWNDMTSIEKLRRETEKLLGGKRTKDWSLKSGLNL